MSKNRRRWLCLLLGTGMIACGGGSDREKVPAWVGADPHFALLGRVDGEDLKLDLGAEQAADKAVLKCVREYLIPKVNDQYDWESGAFVELNIDAVFTLSGQDRTLEIELKRHDMRKDEVGSAFKIKPYDEEKPNLPTELNLEFEWHTGNTATDSNLTWEVEALKGSGKVELFEGAVSSNGLTITSNEGSVGLYLNADLPGSEYLSLSVSALCGANRLRSP